MKAIFLTEIKKLEVHDAPITGSVAGGQVRVRVKKVGICGSDLHYFKHDRIGARTVSFPFILGMSRPESWKRLEKMSRM